MGGDSLCDRRFGFSGRLGFNWNFWFGAGIGRARRLGGLRFFLRLVDRPDHVKGALWIVFELIVQDALAAVERVLQADILSLDAAELLGREKRLGQKSLQPAGAADDVSVVRRELLHSEHGNDVLEFLVVRQRLADFLRQQVMPLHR